MKSKELVTNVTIPQHRPVGHHGVLLGTLFVDCIIKCIDVL